MGSFFRKTWKKYISFNFVQKTLFFSILASVILTLSTIVVSQEIYDKFGTFLIISLLIFICIVGLSLVILITRFFLTRIRNSEKLKALGLMNSKKLFIYSLIALCVSLGVIFLGFTKNSFIATVALFSLASLSALICGVLILKFLFRFKIIRVLAKLFIILPTILIIILFAIYLLVGRPHLITGNSMLPTLKNNSYILTTKLPYYVSEPKRGDIIVFTPPFSDFEEYIGRIIGLPGEVICIKEGKVYINDQVLTEKYTLTSDSTKGDVFLEEGKTYKIPEKSYFVMSDNRLNASDSRAWGPINISKISGKAWIHHWPLSEFGTPIE